MSEVKEDRDEEKESSSRRRRSRQDREQELAKNMSTPGALSDRFETRGELRAVDNMYVMCINGGLLHSTTLSFIN